MHSWMSTFDWYQYTLSPSRWHLFRIHNAVEQFTSHLYSKVAHICPRLSWYFVFSYCLPTFHPFECVLCFFLTDVPCHFLVGVSFFCFNSLVFLIHQHVKLLTQRSLLSPSFIETSPVALLTLRIWHMSLPDWSLAAEIR